MKGEAGERRDRDRSFLSELIEKLIEPFGEGSTEDDKVIFAVHISERLRGNDTVMAQLNNNAREHALKADLSDVATDAIVEAMGSREKMATRLLSVKGARGIFLGLLYEMLKRPEARGPACCQIGTRSCRRVRPEFDTSE